MKRRSLLVLWCMASLLLGAQASELHSVLQQLLSRDAAHQKLVLRLQQEQAHQSLERAVSGFEIKAGYRYYDNEIQRDEYEENAVESAITEEDTRYHVELSKTFFPKDFDATNDALKRDVAIHRYQQEVVLSAVEVTADILDDCIQWWEASQMIPLLQNRQRTLVEQWQMLEQQTNAQVVETDRLIEHLQEADDCAEKLLKYQKNKAETEARYGNSMPDVIAALQNFTGTTALPDTCNLTAVQVQWQSLQERSITRIQRKIAWSTIPVYMPEIEISMGYLWRNISQDWNITEDGTTSLRTREQTEAYPEIGVELSIPFDLWNSTRSKKRLLTQYSRELHYRDSEITLQRTRLVNDISAEYRSLCQAVQRKELLEQLYLRQATAVQQTVQLTLEEDASSTALDSARLKREKARVALQKSRYQLYKTVFLIEYLCEDKS